VKAHITRRFSMPWSAPAARMREFVLAMRAIWDCWADGTRLDFRGDFYSHTLMTPFFDPGPNIHGAPAVFVAGVGPRMTEVAAEVADGLIVHGFMTERYLREVTLPAVQAGLARAGRSGAPFELSAPIFVVTGPTEEAAAGAAVLARRQLAFYASTPAYRPVLDEHGWGPLQTELNHLSKAGRWDEMGGLIDDEMLATFAVVAEPPDVGKQLVARFAGLVNRVVPHLPGADDTMFLAQLTAELQAA